MIEKHDMEAGATIVESVLVLPAILLLVVGIMQLAVFYSDSLHLKYAAYQICRRSFLFEEKEDLVGRQLSGDDVLPTARIENGYSYEQGGLMYNVVDVGYRSRIVFPINHMDSEGNPVFPPEGVLLRTKGFYPMLKTEE